MFMRFGQRSLVGRTAHPAATCLCMRIEVGPGFGPGGARSVALSAAAHAYRYFADGPARHGASGAARLLVEVGDIARFATRAPFASWNGTAPIDASSGDQV